jgi:hypothetical protein
MTWVEAVENGDPIAIGSGGTYTWKDKGIGTQRSDWLYKLVQEDAEGKQTESEVVELRKDGVDAGWKAQIVPNPSSGRARLLVSGLEDDWSWEVRDVQGKVLLRRTEHGFGGQKSLELPDLPSGVYFVRMQQGANIKTAIWVDQG